jgi:hypothetical protein
MAFQNSITFSHCTTLVTQYVEIFHANPHEECCLKKLYIVFIIILWVVRAALYFSIFDMRFYFWYNLILKCTHMIQNVPPFLMHHLKVSWKLRRMASADHIPKLLGILYLLFWRHRLCLRRHEIEWNLVQLVSAPKQHFGILCGCHTTQ